MLGSVWMTLIMTSVAAATPATATPLTGPAVDGDLVSISPTTVTLLVDGQPQPYAADQLQRIDLAGSGNTGEPSPAPSAMLVELIDGSRLRASSYTVRSSQAAVEIGGRPYTIPTRLIRAVLLRDQGNNESLRTQWNEFVAAEHEQDAVVYRRGADDEVTLDILEGVLHDVAAAEVEFALDGDKETLKRERVEGLIYFHTPSAKAAATARCRVVTVDGSQWLAQTLLMDGPQLKLTTPAGFELALPLENLRTLDYAAGNLAYLSELEWESVEQSLQLGRLSAIPAIQQYYRPKRDSSFDRQPLRLGGQSYARGLALCSRTVVTYRLAEQWGRLRAVVGLEDRVRDGEISSGVVLSITGDGKTLFQQPINAEDAPQEIDLDVQGVRRLTITVDYGRDGDVADHLNLCDARLTK